MENKNNTNVEAGNKELEEKIAKRREILKQEAEDQEFEKELASKKRKKTIKKVAAIFFAILLLLTFFSNTILNYTLPEVSIKYIGSGNVNTAVMGQGTVENKKSYVVKAKGNRTVKDVFVKKDDEVKKGQLLMTYKEGSDTDLEAAKDDLESKEISYAKSLLEKDPDYDEQNRTIANNRDTLKKAMEKLEEAKENKEKLDELTEEKEKLEKKIKKLEKKSAKIKKQIEEMGTVESVDSLNEQLKSAQENLAQYNQDLADLKEDYEAAKAQAAADGVEADLKQMERTIRDKEKQIAKEQANIAELNTKIAAATNANSTLKSLNEKSESLTAEIEKKTEKKGKLETKISELTSVSDVETAKSELDSAKEALETAIESLADTKETDNLNEQSKEYDKKQTIEELEEARKKVKELTTDDIINVYAKEDGVVDIVNVTKGKAVQKDDELINIRPSVGKYIINCTVSKEAAKSIKVGDKASIAEDWEDNMKAKVKAVTPDSEDSSKCNVEFSIKGPNVAVGDSYNLSVGGKSTQYDMVVSNNTIKEDNSGKFVYIVNVKSTPIGNRYNVKKVPVEIVATDGSKSAVNGDLSSMSNIVSNSSKPLEDGKQVKLADE
ncbi:MAG: HlyD family efflux transporter periplasmic adaptor subunit [Lachnospiraceae bacterium]|nr:HlyD family efflux transporter periplasmic adaptor subunit [Lachnospiraceae bacterium]